MLTSPFSLLISTASFPLLITTSSSSSLINYRQSIIDATLCSSRRWHLTASSSPELPCARLSSAKRKESRRALALDPSSRHRVPLPVALGGRLLLAASTATSYSEPTGKRPQLVSFGLIISALLDLDPIGGIKASCFWWSRGLVTLGLAALWHQLHALHMIHIPRIDLYSPLVDDFMSLYERIDRTNVAQYAYSLAALWHQLHALHMIHIPRIDLDSPLADDFMSLYERMGDTLALQNGGSPAHNKDHGRLLVHSDAVPSTTSALPSCRPPGNPTSSHREQPYLPVSTGGGPSPHQSPPSFISHARTVLFAAHDQRAS
ncbi:hypothetical protein ZIOFF_043050 [Zingiber officinale]|uniref:SAC domain-containing protein n=1 Tax=Zingiber officinale TaxID=94328 RepID=A0A8J5FWN7_ZINOF|nr:hypothetical protein ZIOFF_043050 [Zingiber officinale]